ncbi:hypothetical protein D1872_274540 [compost metagenome]
MIAAGDHHNPTVIRFVPDDLGVPEIPAARLFALFARVLDHDRTLLGIRPSPAGIFAVRQTDALISVRGIRIIGSIISDQALAPGLVK